MIRLSDEETLRIYRGMVEDIIGEEKICKSALFFKFYNLILKEEAKLIYNLSEQGNTDIMFSIYHYLALNGWLSSKRDFQLTASPDELYSRPEVSICMGGGCCRHLAPHFLTIMNILNNSKTKSFHLVGTNYEKFRGKLPNANEITYSIDHDAFDYFQSGEEYDYHYPNHLEVLSKIDKTLYDPLNFNIQRIDFDDQNLENYIGPMDLAMGMIYDSSVSSFEKQVRLHDVFYKNISFFKRYSLLDEELIKLRKVGIDICLSNMDKIKDYNEKYDKAYQYVKNKAKKYTHNYLKNS